MPAPFSQVYEPIKLSPWIELPALPPFVLDADKEIILEFNRTAQSEHRYDLSLHPEPFIGSLASQVALLALNPGISQEDYAIHSDPFFRRIFRDNCTQAASEIPFYYLQDEFLDLPGGIWWRKKLRLLIDKFGRNNVSRSICCIQLYPYHSQRFSRLPRATNTVDYTVLMVRQAMASNKLLVVMRAWSKWASLVPEITTYENLIRLKNPLNPALSPANAGVDFSRLVQLIGQL